MLSYYPLALVNWRTESGDLFYSDELAPQEHVPLGDIMQVAAADSQVPFARIRLLIRHERFDGRSAEMNFFQLDAVKSALDACRRRSDAPMIDITIVIICEQ